MQGDIPIIGGEKREYGKTVEVCRSFAYKLNLQNHGGPAYESADFFASRKIECSIDAVAWVSQQIYEECVTEVRGAVAAFISEMQRKRRGPAARPEERIA